MCAFVRAGGIESCWVRKFSICEDFSSVCAFVRAGGIESCWVRKFSLCEDFSECICAFVELDAENHTGCMRKFPFVRIFLCVH